MMKNLLYALLFIILVVGLTYLLTLYLNTSAPDLEPIRAELRQLEEEVTDLRQLVSTSNAQL